MTDTAQSRIQSFAFVIAAGTALCFAVCFVASAFSRLQQPCEIKLESRISPNTAPVASMVRLPMIGLTRAQAIVSYRNNLIDKNDVVGLFKTATTCKKSKA